MHAHTRALTHTHTKTLRGSTGTKHIALTAETTHTFSHLWKILYISPFYPWILTHTHTHRHTHRHTPKNTHTHTHRDRHTHTHTRTQSATHHHRTNATGWASGEFLYLLRSPNKLKQTLSHTHTHTHAHTHK